MESGPGAPARAGESALARSHVAELLNELESLRQRLLVAEQARELAFTEVESLQARVDQVTALCDLAEWAQDAAPTGQPASVRVDELRRALAG